MFAAICTLAFKIVIAVPPAFAKIDCRNSCWDVGFCGRHQICFSLLNKLRFHFCARRKEFVTFSSLSWYCRIRGRRSIWSECCIAALRNHWRGCSGSGALRGVWMRLYHCVLRVLQRSAVVLEKNIAESC